MSEQGVGIVQRGDRMLTAPIGVGAMPADSNGPPQQARVFDLVLDNSGNKLDLYYSNSGVIEFEDEQDWDQELCDFLYDRSNGNAPSTMYGSVIFPVRNANPKRPQVELSLRAPVEESYGSTTIAKEVDRALYVIRLLTKQGRNLEPSPDELRFSTSFDPFSVSLKDLPSNDRDKVFSMPHFVHPDGVVAPDGDEHAPEEYRVATVACFLFDLERAKRIIPEQQQQQRQQQQEVEEQDVLSTPDFVARFNLNLELATRRRGYGQNQLREFLPIIIDPDIGHPGGNAAGP